MSRFLDKGCKLVLARKLQASGKLLSLVSSLALVFLILILTLPAHAAIGGTVLWQVRDSKTGVQMPTIPTGSAVDTNGNVYITGFQRLISGTTGEDFYTIKITTSGCADSKPACVDSTWGPKTHNQDNADDRATAIAVDSDNNVIVVGNVTMGDGSKHVYIVKYSGINGNILWEHTFMPTSPEHTSDTAVSLAVYGGNVYVTGIARISGSTNDDILILKYDNSYSDGGSHAPLKVVVFDRSGTQDAAASISATANGVAVVGRTWDGTEFDMLTLKYDLNLDMSDPTKQIWQHSAPGGNASGNNGSWGRFVKIDSDGNVIATGFDISSSTDTDIYTAKYCDNATAATCNGVAQGAMAWERRYNGSFSDDVNGLVVDANKDVYITGVTSPISSSNDFYTAKYNGGNGTLAWQSTTDGGSNIDMPNGLVVDEGGEVYITGYTKLNGVDTIQTMKYRKNTTSGRLLWQKTFKNPDQPDILDIRGTGIGLSSGGVVVSGWASKLSEPSLTSGIATGGSFNTLQHTGKTWPAYANYYLKITSGLASGQVRLIISNSSDTLTVSPPFTSEIQNNHGYEIYSLDTDYFALKYEKGTLDRPTDLATSLDIPNKWVHLTWSDNSSTETGFTLERCEGKGCDFTTGVTTISLSANAISYDDKALQPDTYYNYRVKAYTDTPAESSDYSNSARAVTVFVTYSMPLPANIFTYDGATNKEDTSPAVAVGPDNNPVVTGRSFLNDGGSNTFDYYTIKLDSAKLSLPAGKIWSASYDGGQADNDEATCLAVDKDNKVIVSGDSVLPPLGGGGNMSLLMTLKYLNPPAIDSGSGLPTHSWYEKYNGPGKLDDHATAVATDAVGNFVVLGHGKKDSGNHHYFYLLKYNADNTRAWVGELYDAGDGGKPVAVAFGADNNIFVTGQRNEGTALSPDYNYITLKYCGNSDTTKCNGKTPGQIIWSDVYDSTRGNDQAAAMTIDSSNNVYVTGSAINSSNKQDFYTIKYDGAAITPLRLWEGKGLVPDGSETGEAVAAGIDKVSGDLLVAGTTLTDAGNHDFVLIRYKADGTLIKKKVLYRPDNDDFVIGMALDASGNAFVAGNTNNGNGTASMTIQFDSAGDVIQSKIYNASIAQEDVTTNIAVNSANEAFVVGTTRRSSIDYLLYKIPVWPIQAPSPVTVTAGYTTLSLSWTATSSASGVSYKGKRADGACSDSSVFGSEFNVPASSYTDSNLPQNTSYCYAFKTITTPDTGQSRWVPITAKTLDPAAPTVTLTTTNTTQIDLTWTNNTTGQNGFEVWRCADTTTTPCSGSDFTRLTTPTTTATSYSDLTVCPGTIYRYQIRAVGTGWNSAFSTTLGGITPTVDNIFVDSGIEASNPFALGQSLGWTYCCGLTASEMIYDTGVFHGGAQSLNVNAIASTPQGGIKQYVRFSPGGKYQLSAWFKTAAPAGKVACDSLDGSSFLIANTGTTSNWEQVTQTLTVPSPSASSRVRCYVYQGYQGNIDDIQVKPVYDLTATSYSESQVNLSWLDSSYDETGYEIWRCKDPDQSTACVNFALIDKVVANLTTYSSTGLEPNAKYRFQIRPYKTATGSCGGGWTGAFSNIAGPAQALYTKPTLSKTIPNTTQVDLSWNDTTSSESSFLLQRCTGNSCPFDVAHGLVETQRPFSWGVGTNQTWSDTGVCVSNDYQYRVKPVNNGIQSASGCWNKSTSLSIASFKANFITRVKILGSASGYTGMKADFSDIRIYDETGKKELPYWIESKSDTNWAIVWFKTGASNNIKLYYDNLAATSTSDLTSVFGSGLKAFYPFSETPFLAGTSYDRSGLGNDLSLNYITAGYGVTDPGALKLGPDSGNVLNAGSNNRSANRGTATLPTGATATIEAWIYPRSPQNYANNGIISFGENLQAQRIYLAMQDNGRPAMFGFNNDFVPATGSQAVFNAWNHIAVVVTGTPTPTATLYLNGQAASQALALTFNLKSQYLYVGMYYDGNPFNGFIDDVRIYDRALDATDIAMRYASVLPSVTVGTPSGSNSCQTFSGGWGDDTFYSNALPVSMVAPVPPTTLNAVANNEAQVTLTWKNKTSDQTGFKIFRCSGSGCSFSATPDYTFPNTAAINATVTYTDNTGLVPGLLYKYKVQAYKTGVTCPWDSAADTAQTQNTVTMPLNAPSGLNKAYSFSSTCNDLRFTDSDGSTILSHWIESGCNSSATTAWLKFTSLPAGAKTIYLHYNNTAATAPAVPDLNTFFDFYDDFAGQTLNASKWTRIETCGSHITQNNGLIVDGGCASLNWNTVGMYSVTNFSRPFVLEFSHNHTGGNYAMFGAKNTAANTNYSGLVYGIYPVYDVNGNRLQVYQDNVQMGENLKTIPSIGWEYFKLEVPSTGANYYHGNAPVPSSLNPSGYTQFFTSAGSSATPLKLGMDVYNQAFKLGSVKLRKYANPEPTLSLLPEQSGSFLTGGAWKIKRQINIINSTGAALPYYQLPVFVNTTPLAVDQIKLHWINNTTSEEGYIIERCDNTASSDNCATFNVEKTFNVTGNGINSYIDREIKINNAYCYRVKATRTTAPAWITTAGSIVCETPRHQVAPVLTAVGTTTQIKLDWTESDFVSESGAATSGSTTTLTHSTKTWATDQWSGYQLKMTGGAAGNIGVIRKIVSNNDKTINVDTAFPAAIANTHGYQIIPGDGYGNMMSGIIGEYGYEVERCQDTGSGCTPAPMDPKVILAPDALRTYTDLLCSGSFKYRLHVLKYGANGSLLSTADGWPEYSNTVSANITSAPAPTKVKAVRVSEAKITLTWQDNTGDETNFNIYRCKDVGGVACTNFVLLKTVSAATATATGFPAGTGTIASYDDTNNIAPDSTYRYQVTATGTGAICPTWESLAGTPDSSYVSGEARATTFNTAPNLSVTAANTTQVNVAWGDNTATEGAFILERCTGAGCSDFSYLGNLGSIAAPARQNKVFYPFSSNLNDMSGSGLNLTNTPVVTYSGRVPYFPDGLYLCNNCDESFQSPVTGILNSENHAIEFDFKIRQYIGSWGKVFGYTVATANPDKSSPGIFVATSGAGYGLVWTYLDSSGTAGEIHIGVNGIGDASGAFTVDQWYHIRGEKSGSSFKLYLDGVLKGTTTVASPQYAGNYPLTFGKDAQNGVARINLKNFSIDANVQFTDSSECAGQTYSYRAKAVRDGFVSSNVNVSNFQANSPTKVIVPASIVAGRTLSQLNDLRFYDYTAKADVPYWLESVLPDGTAIAWIKSANSTITLYANKNATGGVSASSASGVYGIGLVGFWPFDLDANDISGNANGVLTNGATIVAGGKKGKSLSLDGINDYLDIPIASGSTLDLTSSMTIDFWYYYDSTLTDAENSGKPLINRAYDNTPANNRKINLYLGYTNALNSSGSASAAGTTTTLPFTSSTLGSWAAGALVNSTIKITGGTAANIGLTSTITANTTTGLTFSPALNANVASGDTFIIYGSATADSTENNTITNTSWVLTTANMLATQKVTMISGDNSGQWRYVTGNTTDTITFYPPFTNPVKTGDQYTISSYITNTNRTVNFAVADAAFKLFRSDYGGPVPYLANNAWNHIVGRYDAANAKISVVVNGVESNPNTVLPSGFSTTLGASGQSLKIGTNSGVSAYHKGKFDEVRIYNRPLSDAEIASHYNNTFLSTGTVDTAVAFPASLATWKASTPVQIANFQPNYQTRLIVTKAALMNNDFSDLRFYDTTAQAALQYWIESKTDGVSATIWVKTGNTNTIAMYYGNSGATSTAVSADVMFAFYEDFTNADISRWDKSDGLADITVDSSGSGTVRINSGALVTKIPVLSNPKDYAFEMKTYLVGSPTNTFFTGLVVANARLLAAGNANGNTVARANFTSANSLQGVAADGTTNTNNLLSPIYDTSASYVGASNAGIIGFGFPGSNPIRFFSRNPIANTDRVPQVASDGTWKPTNNDTNAYLYLGNVWGMGGLAADTSDLVIDWVRVRKFAYPEPQASVNTGQFPNFTLAQGGSWNAGLLLNINNFLPNQQTMMTVNWRSGMKTDFSDIRFYDTTAKAELPYWIENYTSSSMATVWLKTGVNKNIAMYYGNTLATSASNGANVFEFFDDFTGSSLDATKWSKSDETVGAITLDNSVAGKLRINTGAVYSKLPVVATPQNLVYEMKSQWTGTVVSYSQMAVSNYQYFIAGNSGSSTYATNRLQSNGSLYAQIADGTAAGNNVYSDYYPNSTTYAQLNTDSIIGMEFQGDTGKISFSSKNPTTLTDIARITKPVMISVRDNKKVWTRQWTGDGTGYDVLITSGLNKDQRRRIVSNTTNALTVYVPITAPTPDNSFPYFFTTGDTYQIIKNWDQSVVDTGSVTDLWNVPSYLWLGSYLGSGTGTAGGATANNTDLIVDWVRIRKYVNPMPSVTMDAINVNQAPAPDIYQFLNNWSSPYSSTITIMTPQVANIASNSDFENGNLNWTVGANVTEDITTAASGIKSLKASKVLAKNTSELTSLPLPQLLPGGSYTLSGNIKANLTNGTAFCRLAVNNGTLDNPGVGAPEFDIFNSSPRITWNKINNSIPTASNSTSTDGTIPLGISTGGAGHAVSPYGTPTDKGDTGAVQGAAVIKEGATYRMWYSGNDHGVSGSWRIYYATSGDGISWNKVDTTLPPVQDSGTIPSGNNGRLGLGNDVAGIGDRFHVYVSPAVIKDVDIDGFTPLYKMWYSGHDRSNWRIYYATSPDGLNWTKYDNTVETANNLTGTRGRIPLGSGAVGDKSHTYAPTVVKDTSTNPATYKMWYSGNDGTRWRVFYATSTDGGLTWTKKNNVAVAARDLTPPPANENSGQIPEGTAGKADDFYAYMPHVIVEGSLYKMWYTGLNVSGYNDPATRINRVLYATSTDGGLNWTKQNNAQPVAIDSPATTSSSQLPNGSASTGDSFGPIATFVLREAANTYTMWYSGIGGNIPQIYRATTINGGSTWTKQDNSSPARSDLSGTNGRIPRGVATKGDTFHTSWPSIIKESESSYKMWYNGTDGINWRIYYATSSDGLNWSKLDNTIPAMSDTTGTNGRLSFGSGGKGDSLGVLSPSVVKDTFEPDVNQRYKMWYSGNDGFAWRGIFMATSPDGLAWTKKDNSTFTTYQNTGAGPGGGRLFTGQDVTTPAIGDNRQIRAGSGSVVWDGDQNYKMWYSGNNANWRIFMATSTDGGLTWNKVNNVVTANRDSGVTPTDNSGQIPLGSAGTGDSIHTFMPTVYKDGTTYKMWYAGSDGANWRIYYATSTDGYNWTKYDNSVPTVASDGVTTNGRIALGSTGKGDNAHIQGVTVINDGSTARMWYTGFDLPIPQRQRLFSAVQTVTPGDSNNDNLWHSFSLPITLNPSLSTADAANLRILCGISRDKDTPGIDATETANFDMIQLVPNNLSAFNLTATKGSESRIDLAWSDMATDETGYKIWRCKDPDQVTACSDFGSSPLATVAAGVISYNDTNNIVPNTTYRYKIGAYKSAPGSCNGGWDSNYSNIAFAKTDDASPGSLTANAINTNQVDLSWVDKSTGESGFAIERSTDGATFTALPPYPTPPYPTLVGRNSTSFSDTTVCPSTTYTYRLRSLNRGLSLDGGLGNSCTTATDGWSKRKHLVMSSPGNANSFQPQFQVSLTVNFVTGMKSDFSDLRFFDATAGIELPYSIERKSDGVYAVVWLKTGDNNNIDMYYGNSKASSASNPSKVFDFYEEFTGSAIDTTKWDVADASGLSVSGGFLHGTNTSGQIKSKATIPAGSSLEYKAKATKWADNPWYIGGLSASSKYLGWVPYYNWYFSATTWPSQTGRGIYYLDSDGGFNIVGYGVDYSVTDFPSKTQLMSSDNMMYRITAKDAANLALHIDELDRLDGQNKPLVVTDVPNQPSTYSAGPIILGGSVANPGESMQVDWDWVRVRKYVATEPIVTLDFEVASSSLNPSQTCFSFSNQWGEDASNYYSTTSNPVRTPTAFAPSKVIAYEVTPTRIDLSWADNTGSEETGFKIQDCGANCTNTAAAAVNVAANSTTYSFTNLTAGTDHCYRVRAYKTGACGWPTDWSAPACVTLSNNIHLDATALGPFAVRLDWNNVPDDQRGFEIEKKLVNGNFTNIATVGNVLTYNDKIGVEPLKQYTYRVRKTDNADEFLNGINPMTWTSEVGHLYRRIGSSTVMAGNTLESPYTVIQDNSLDGSSLQKNSWTPDQWLGCPVLISSGGTDIFGTVSGNINTQFFMSPALTAQINANDTYRILNTVSGTAYNNSISGYNGSAAIIVDALKNWRAGQWTATLHYVKIVSSVNSANMGQVRKIANFTYNSLTVDTAFPVATVGGDTYQVASDFGIATPGSSTTILKDASKNWSTDFTAGYYLMMTSGVNNGKIRKITGYTATSLTVSPAFDNDIAANDSYLIASTGLTGTVSNTVAIGASQGTAKSSATGGKIEFSSVSAGVGSNYNYELMYANDLTPFKGEFDMQVDYNLPDGSMTSTLNNTNHYACLRYQFYVLPTATYPYQYQSIICRGRLPITDNGRATGGTTTSLVDTRTMPGTTTPWKNWATDQWKGQYLQMTNGSNTGLIRKIAGNTANTITLETPFPVAIVNTNTYRINNIQATAASSGNSNVKLVDGATTPAKDWIDHKLAGFQLKMTSGPNVGQTRTIADNTATTITVSPAFDNLIGNYASGGDSYQIFDTGENAKAKEYYLVSNNEPYYNVGEINFFPTSDVAGSFRIARSVDSIMFYISDSNGDWNLLRQVNLPASAAVTPTFMGLYGLGSLSETAGTSIRSELDNFLLSTVSGHGVLGSSNENPYSNEATVTYTYPNDYAVPALRNTTISTTPGFIAIDGVCRP